MLAVDCGSAPPTAWRALRAAICSGVACFAAAGASPQKPRALMMSAGVSGFASFFAAGGAAGFEGLTIWASADASWKVAAAAGLARGTGTGSADLAGTAAAIRPAADGFSGAAAVAPPSSSSSADDLPLLNKEASRLGLLLE